MKEQMETIKTMRDERQRNIDYIRISVTDRCNFRCRYCMPEEGVEEKRHEDILTYEEILRVCRSGVSLGIRKVKITGGEPLVRKGVCGLITEICKVDGIEDVTMTTNGYLLTEYAIQLKEAGLSSVNVSLDTLDREEFAWIARRDGFVRVMAGIDAAVAAGLKVKVNCAVSKILTEKEIQAFAQLSVQKHIPVRFIEMMPVGQGRMAESFDNDRLKQILMDQYPDFTPYRGKDTLGNGPACYYIFDGGKGCVGFISAVHHKFCAACNRVRLTSDGFLKLCLDSSAGVDLRPVLRQDGDRQEADRELCVIMARWIFEKPESHNFQKGHMGMEDRDSNALSMNQIGG